MSQKITIQWMDVTEKRKEEGMHNHLLLHNTKDHHYPSSRPLHDSTMDIETAIDNITDLQDKLERIISALRLYQVEHNTVKSANSISVGSYNLDVTDDLNRKLQHENKEEQ